MDQAFGRWRVRLRGDGPALARAYALRAGTFRDGASDRDEFDATYQHLTIEADGALEGYARLAVQDPAAMLTGYSAQFYGLEPVAARHDAAVEVGRVCLASDDPDLPRVLLAALAQVVDRSRAGLLYGCASFQPGEWGALGQLAVHVAADGPVRKSFRTKELRGEAQAVLPTMLRLYLAFGAQVSDHAVTDHDLGTAHVLAMLPVDAIPPARARLLRALAPVGAEG